MSFFSVFTSFIYWYILVATILCSKFFVYSDFMDFINNKQMPKFCRILCYVFWHINFYPRKSSFNCKIFKHFFQHLFQQSEYPSLVHKAFLDCYNANIEHVRQDLIILNTSPIHCWFLKLNKIKCFLIFLQSTQLALLYSFFIAQRLNLSTYLLHILLHSKYYIEHRVRLFFSD